MDGSTRTEYVILFVIRVREGRGDIRAGAILGSPAVAVRTVCRRSSVGSLGVRKPGRPGRKVHPNPDIERSRDVVLAHVLLDIYVGSLVVIVSPPVPRTSRAVMISGHGDRPRLLRPGTVMGWTTILCSLIGLELSLEPRVIVGRVLSNRFQGVAREGLVMQ